MNIIVSVVLPGASAKPWVGFECRKSTRLERYFAIQVSQDNKRRVASCFVALDAGDAIAGFYTLAATSVALTKSGLKPNKYGRKQLLN